MMPKMTPWSSVGASSREDIWNIGMHSNVITIQKDNMTARITKGVLESWTERGWTVVEDGSSESGQEPAPGDGEGDSASATETKE